MQDASGTPPATPTPTPQRDRTGLIGGLVLVTLGLLFLADNFIPDVRFGDFWPLILIVIGGAMLWKTKKN